MKKKEKKEEFMTIHPLVPKKDVRKLKQLIYKEVIPSISEGARQAISEFVSKKDEDKKAKV